MAEQLIIHVKVDGFSPQKETGKSGGSAAAAAGAIGAASLFRNEGPHQGSLSPRNKGGNDYAARYKGESWMSRADYAAAGLEDSGYGGYGGKLTSFGTRRMVGGSGIVSGGLQEQETLFGLGARKTGDFYAENQMKVKAAGSALAWKAADSAVKVAQHRSGDSYANAQLNNAMKIVGYGTAIAMSGPAAPFVAAGIAVNEIVNGVVGGINYRFDRALEGDQIRNMKVIAGDMSYGRRRGAL